MQHQGTEPVDGVVIASGWGVKVFVDRGHLIIHDGIGEDRRTLRLSRLFGGLQRLVVIGHTGFVTLEAMRWIRDVGASLCQIGLDGELIALTSADRYLDPKLRRAQALASGSQAGVAITRELVGSKLTRQLEVLSRLQSGDLDLAERAGEIVERAAERIGGSKTLKEIRGQESVAGRWYWKAVATTPIVFDAATSRQVPNHWRMAGPRTSAGTSFKGPRKAATPMHAALNYGYAVLETEARIALLAYGLDPSLGIIHTDKRYRGSLAADLMEPVRPAVDELVLDLLATPVGRGAFYESREGICRIGPSIGRKLGEAAPALRAELLPHAARLADSLRDDGRADGRRPRRREPGTAGRGTRLARTPS